MSLELLDSIRGYLIGTILISMVLAGITASATSKAARWTRGVAFLAAAVAALGLFFMLTMVGGWEEYFAAKSAGNPASLYEGRHRAAARVIQTIGDMRPDALGIFFGVLGAAFLFAAARTIKSLLGTGSRTQR